MLNTESTPLVKSTDTNFKSTITRIICLAISLVVLIIIFYGNSSPIVQNMSHIELNADINSPALIQTRFPKYPSESVLKKYRTMTRMIEYEADELPQEMDATNFDSIEMREFHSELIEMHGYNHEKHNIIFAVSNTPIFEYESDIQSDQTSKDKLSCQYLYSYASSSESGKFMELNCASEYTITGCTSMSRYSDGIRWGELAYDTSDCFTHAVGSSKTDFYGTVLTASCCKVDNSITELHTTYSTSVTSNSDFCVETECPLDTVSIGCTATDSHQATYKFSGTRWLRNSHFLSGCKTQRNDLGYLWQATYCAKLTNNNSKNDLVCYSKDGGDAVKKESGDYESEAVCNGKEYVMTDCNGYITESIDYCTAGKVYGNHLGILYGSYMLNNGQSSATNSKSPICFAVGSTDAVRAQAICCKIK